MRYVKIKDNISDEQRVLIESKVSSIHFSSSPDTVFESIDDNLKEYGLEIVMISEGTSDYLYYIDKRKHD